MVWEALVDLPTWDLSKGRFFRRGMIPNLKPITNQSTKKCLNHLSYKKNLKNNPAYWLFQGFVPSY